MTPAVPQPPFDPDDGPRWAIWDFTGQQWDALPPHSRPEHVPLPCGDPTCPECRDAQLALGHDVSGIPTHERHVPAHERTGTRQGGPTPADEP